jgi:hypothetical protein
MRSKTLDRPRIKTKHDARRCIAGLMNYFYRHESPLAAEDLQDAVDVLTADARAAIVRRVLDVVVVERPDPPKESR